MENLSDIDSLINMVILLRLMDKCIKQKYKALEIKRANHKWKLSTDSLSKERFGLES